RQGGVERIVVIGQKGAVGIVGAPWHSGNGGHIGADHVVGRPADVVHGELLDGVDELVVDVQGAGDVEDDLELGLFDDAVEQGDDAEHPDEIEPGRRVFDDADQVDRVDRREGVDVGRP